MNLIADFERGTLRDYEKNCPGGLEAIIEVRR